MDDIRFCGNIIPKFPGGPQQGGFVSQGIVTAAIIPALTGSLRLEPPPEPVNVQSGFAG